MDIDFWSMVFYMNFYGICYHLLLMNQALYRNSTEIVRTGSHLFRLGFVMSSLQRNLDLLLKNHFCENSNQLFYLI
jgi:hypothetical protein